MTGDSSMDVVWGKGTTNCKEECSTGHEGQCFLTMMPMDEKSIGNSSGGKHEREVSRESHEGLNKRPNSFGEGMGDSLAFLEGGDKVLTEECCFAVNTETGSADKRGIVPGSKEAAGKRLRNSREKKQEIAMSSDSNKQKYNPMAFGKEEFAMI